MSAARRERCPGFPSEGVRREWLKGGGARGQQLMGGDQPGGTASSAGRGHTRESVLLFRFSVVLTLLFLGPCSFYLVTTSFRATENHPQRLRGAASPIHE